MSAETKVGKVAEWKRRLRRYERTELTVAEFCQREGISVSSLYQWMRTLAGMPQGNASELKANRLPKRLPCEASASFRAIEVSPALNSGSATIRLPGGVVIELPDDSATLKWLLGRACRTTPPGKGDSAC
ncbi:MAG: IS66 family insertion sequence element accessory protein TnpA [Planctomycetota bacterium]|jgi:transposase-like protein